MARLGHNAQRLVPRRYAQSPAISEREAQVFRALRLQLVPGTTQDVVFAGHVEEVKESAGVVTVYLKLDDKYRELRRVLTASLPSQLPWATAVHVRMHAEPVDETKPKKPAKSEVTPNGLAKVKWILAVSSCKGGVGKSTVAVNLAYSMSQQGLKVGIFDADLYGPSLPTLVNPPDKRIGYTPEECLTPLVFQGVKLMSYGFVRMNQTHESKASIMRGPMASSVVTKMATTTDWGELDVLVLDLPPGTGDITLSLAQQLRITAALIVTTPQKLSFIDVIKGMEMFQQTKIPMIGVVQNMSYFICDGCTKQHRFFGPGYAHALKEQFGIQNSFEIPLFGELSRLSDSGLPFVLDSSPATLDTRTVYTTMAAKIAKELQDLSNGQLEPPVVTYEPNVGVVLTAPGSKDRKIIANVKELRLKCRCARCVEEFTGRAMISGKDIPDAITPLKISPRGNYAVEITWSDRHGSIFSYSSLQEQAQ